MNDKALTRRAFLLGTVGVVGAMVLPKVPVTAAGASIGGGILRTGLMQGGLMPTCPPSCSWVESLQWKLQDLVGVANTKLQSWVQDAIGKETYQLFASWFSDDTQSSDQSETPRV